MSFHVIFTPPELTNAPSAHITFQNKTIDRSMFVCFNIFCDVKQQAKHKSQKNSTQQYNNDDDHLL